MDKRKFAVGSVVTIILLAICGWMFGFFGGTDPALAELQQLGDQMFNRDLSDAQRDQLRADFRQRMEGLTDAQRQAFFEANRGQWTARAEQRMNDFFAMSPQEQNRELDEMLNRMTQPRPERNDGKRGGAGRDGGRGGWQNMTEAQRDERSKRRLDHTSPKMRAQFTEFRNRLENRAKERGIDPGSLPDFGRPGGGGRGRG